MYVCVYCIYTVYIYIINTQGLVRGFILPFTHKPIHLPVRSKPSTPNVRMLTIDKAVRRSEPPVLRQRIPGCCAAFRKAKRLFGADAP